MDTMGPLGQVKGTMEYGHYGSIEQARSTMDLLGSGVG